MSKFGLLVKWFKESPRVRLAAGLVYLVGLGFLFFRFTGGTGISVFVVLSGVLGFWFYNNPAAHLLAFLPLMALMALNEWFLQRRKRQYLPAIAEVEGGGIKRGLTAPEAAILLELPLGKVLTLVIFGLLKKRIVRQIQADPLIVEVKPPFRAQDAVTGDPKELAKFYRRVAKENKTIIRHYEHPFLFLLEANVAKPVAELNFSVPVKKLIERVARRMKGFDLSDTQDYYRSIVSRAMKQAKSIGEIPEREKTIDRNLEWLLLDDDYPTVFAHRGYYYRPMWTRGALGGSMPMPTGGVSAPAAPGGTTSFGDVAASFAGWSENTMGQMASAIQPGTLTFGEAHAGVLDLSGADRVTGDFFKSLAESGGGGGGGGGFSGGCACAGCACACACAGGGR